MSAASTEQRFCIGDWVSHNAGMIDAESKRRVKTLVGYNPDVGYVYWLEDEHGGNRGMASDDELDAWPDEGTALPTPSPRSPAR